MCLFSEHEMCIESITTLWTLMNKRLKLITFVCSLYKNFHLGTFKLAVEDLNLKFRRNMLLNMGLVLTHSYR